jgi:hypothetical protein
MNPTTILDVSHSNATLHAMMSVVTIAAAIMKTPRPIIIVGNQK